MAASALTVSGGFADPVFDAQAVFRRVMEAFAQPGTIVDLGGRATAPAPLAPATAALLAALADADAPVFMEEPGADAAAWIAFHTGARVVTEPVDAAFACLAAKSEPTGWARFPFGTDAYPDRSATLLLPCADWTEGVPLVLSGPGIETERRIAPAGLPDGFLAARAGNAALFPRGHDLVLVCGAEAMALPRTTRIREA